MNQVKTTLKRALNALAMRRSLVIAAFAILLLPACGGLYLYDTVTPSDQDGDGLLDSEERRYGTSIYDADTDGDGLYDDEEIFDYATDPLRYDTDEDGLWDGEEVFDFFTDPLSWDSDGDGFSDGFEVETGRDPLRFNRR